jgi:hypothetical protein
MAATLGSAGSFRVRSLVTAASLCEGVLSCCMINGPEVDAHPIKIGRRIAHVPQLIFFLLPGNVIVV